MEELTFLRIEVAVLLMWITFISIFFTYKLREKQEDLDEIRSVVHSILIRFLSEHENKKDK